MVSDDFYLTLSSDGSETFSSNSHSDFKIKLRDPLQLEHGYWKVGITTIHYPRHIQNLDSSCFVKVWTGDAEHTIKFPNWSCYSANDIVLYLQVELGQIRFRSINWKRNDDHENKRTKRQTLRPEFARMYEEEKRELEEGEEISEITNKAPGEVSAEDRKNYRKRINKPDLDTEHEPATYLDAASVNRQFSFDKAKYMLQHFKGPEVNSQDSTLEKLAQNTSAIPFLTSKKPTVFGTHVPEYPLFEDLNRMMRNSTSIKEELNAFNHLITEIINNEGLESVAAKRSKVVLPEIKLKEKKKYRPTIFFDYLKRLRIDSDGSPDFDICFSDSLQTRLGFTNNMFSVHNYERRRFFQHFLLLQSAKVLFLQGKGFQKLLQCDEWLRAQIDSSNDSPYSHYVTNLICNILRMKPLQIYHDLTACFESEKAKTLWNVSQNLNSFFVWEDVANLQKVLRGTANDAHPISEFEKGTVLAYYMLKTLFSEHLLSTNELSFADIPPRINNPFNPMFVYSDIVQPISFNETKMPLLTIIHNDALNTACEMIAQQISNPNYIPCNTGIIPAIRVYIASTDGTLVPFMTGPVIVQLHFKRFPAP